MALNNGNSKLL